MKYYRATQAHRKRPMPVRISNDYWQAYRSLYGRNKSEKTSPTSGMKIDDLNAEKMPEVLS